MYREKQSRKKEVERSEATSLMSLGQTPQGSDGANCVDVCEESISSRETASAEMPRQRGSRAGRTPMTRVRADKRTEVCATGQGANNGRP